MSGAELPAVLSARHLFQLHSRIQHQQQHLHRFVTLECEWIELIIFKLNMARKDYLLVIVGLITNGNITDGAVGRDEVRLYFPTAQCTIPNCQYCSTPNVCAVCSSGFVLNSMNACVGEFFNSFASEVKINSALIASLVNIASLFNIAAQCFVPNCQTCSSPAVCSVCSTNYNLNQGSCTRTLSLLLCRRQRHHPNHLL